tara:strand:- start:118 stop:813 length:696 start_codon:yes stop_codon:yes gene_type:complete
MKRIFSMLLLVSVLIPFTHIFGIGGFGLQVGQSLFSVAESIDSDDVVLTNGSFDGSFNIGGYLYVDAIPFIDLEIDGSLSGNTYDINFSNNSDTPMTPIPFGWISSSGYFTARKKVFGLSIPFLAGAKLHAGGGFNTHKTTPVANIEIIKNLLGESNLLEGDLSNLDKNLKDFLTDKNNYISSTGIHIQTGLQLNILFLDTFLFYRHTFAKDVVPGQDHFGSLNLRIGYGL